LACPVTYFISKIILPAKIIKKNVWGMILLLPSPLPSLRPRRDKISEPPEEQKNFRKHETI
jgi:hypothetical protein